MATHIHTSYALLGMILLVSSCSQEDISRGDNRETGGRIEFKASFPEISARGAEVSTSALNYIQVSAFTVAASVETPYFEDKKFSRSSSTGMYTCLDPECIWPNEDDVFRFVAFAPSCEDIRSGGGDATLESDKLAGFKVAKDIATQFDFVTAIASGRLLDNEDTGVSLTFHHQLSRIKLEAWGNSPAYDLEIAGVRIGGVATGGEFALKAPEGATDTDQGGVWNAVSKGSVEYIFRAGDAVVALDKSEGSPRSAETAVSILGGKIGGETGYDNSAMIIPSVNTAWQYKDIPANGEGNVDGMYISVLLRVTDDTPDDTDVSVVYPYADDAEAVDRVYFAVDKADGKTVKSRLYRQEDKYFADAELTAPYDFAVNEAEVKAFGWAALPVGGELKPGRVYTYTLNYSNGVGLHDPGSSHPGEPIISDKVLVDVNVEEWLPGADKDVEVPRR